MCQEAQGLLARELNDSIVRLTVFNRILKTSFVALMLAKVVYSVYYCRHLGVAIVYKW